LTGQDGKKRRDAREFSSINKAFSVSFFALLLLTSLHTSATANPAQTKQQYPTGPWGAGVVVPQGSRFTDGSLLSWANVSAVFVEVTLPNITFSDYPTYAVESLMAADGSVMQIAAGIYPGNSKWLAYGWFIADVDAIPQSYDWVLNSSRPEMTAGGPIALSISISGGRWWYRIEDLSTHDVASGEYAATVPPTLYVGDQEVFALESYTTSSVVFAQMGNLTLDALRINGRQIAAGWYEYGSWDPRHNPLFVVGGLNPPSFISLQVMNGKEVWTYEQWSVSTQSQPQRFPLTAVVRVVALVGILLLTAAYVARKRRHDSTEARRTTQPT
jgi:hypothetical protein